MPGYPDTKRYCPQLNPALGALLSSYHLPWMSGPWDGPVYTSVTTHLFLGLYPPKPRVPTLLPPRTPLSPYSSIPAPLPPHTLSATQPSCHPAASGTSMAPLWHCYKERATIAMPRLLSGTKHGSAIKAAIARSVDERLARATMARGTMQWGQV